MRILAILSLIAILQWSNGAKILGVFTVPSKSHCILVYELFIELAKSGHEIVVITPKGTELKNPPLNYKNIVIGGEIINEYEEHMVKAFDEVDNLPIISFFEVLNKTHLLTEKIITAPDVQNLLKSDQKFDLVISEISLNEATLGFSEHYNCPHILISTVGATSFVSLMTGNPIPLSYVPHIFLDMTDKMSFVDRFQNTFMHIAESFLLHKFAYNKQKELYETAFPSSKRFKPFWDKLYNGVSLVFLNSHFSMNYPRPYLPNLIEVGGMHIKKTFDALPTDIQSFIDSAEHGVVFFSLGGNLKPTNMPKEKQTAIINSLLKIKEKIIWKWDDGNANVDKNKFLIKNWFPQDSILAHPKVKLFISHGGLLSGTESIYYGKPLITIPIFGDQKLNAARTAATGIGIRVDYSNLTETSLTWALDEILKNKMYENRAQDLSKRFKNRPQHPLDLAKFYVEYVMENKGAEFLRSQANYLSFVEYYNIDVFIILILIPLLIVYFLFYILKKLIKLVLNGNKSNEPKLKLKKK